MMFISGMSNVLPFIENNQYHNYFNCLFLLDITWCIISGIISCLLTSDLPVMNDVIIVTTKAVIRETITANKAYHRYDKW